MNCYASFIYKAKNFVLDIYKYLNKILCLIMILMFLASCTCGCITHMPDLDLNTTTELSNVTVLANGCGAMDGSVGSDGVTTELCGIANTTDYTNTGRWVKLPKIGASKNSSISLNIYGSVYYCSYGFDNKNPSPYFKAIPGKPASTQFADGTEMVVLPGQLIVLEAGPNNLASFSKATLPTCSLDSTGYQRFINGNCAGQNLLGLTIYINDKEIVTLDATNQAFSDSQSSDLNVFNFSLARTPDLFAYTKVPAAAGVQGTDLQGVIDQINDTYQTTINQNYGLGRYLFAVPENLTGKIGFAIAQEKNFNSTNVQGSYDVSVKATPPACFVVQSAAFNEPDQRGALQMLISNSNPNDIDNALASFNTLSTTQISDYYSSLRNFIAQYAGISINEDAQVLSDLVIPAPPSLSPIVIVESRFYSTLDKSGDIWFKIRDDYYVDNVGQYDVFASITTKKNSKVSDFINSLTKPVVASISSATTVIYFNFFNSTDFLRFIRACLVLSIVLLGLLYTLGLTQISGQDLVIRVLKISVVAQLFSPNSWTFFNDYLFTIFTDGSDYLIAAATGDTSPDKHNLFGFIDDAFNVFFQSATWIKIAALIFDAVGILALATIITVMIVYIFTVAKVVISYLMCILALSLLIALSPIFIVLILFEKTKKFFDSWISSLADYALQSVILFVAFFLVSTLFVTMWLNLMSFDVCYGGIRNLALSINLPATVQGIPLPDIYLGCPWWFVISDGSSYYVLFIQSVSLFIFAYVVRGLIGHISAITAKITGSMAVFGIDKIAQSMEKDVKDAPFKAIAGVTNKALQFAPPEVSEMVKNYANHIPNTSRRRS